MHQLDDATVGSATARPHLHCSGTCTRPAAARRALCPPAAAHRARCEQSGKTSCKACAVRAHTGSWSTPECRRAAPAMQCFPTPRTARRQSPAARASMCGHGEREAFWCHLRIPTAPSWRVQPDQCRLGRSSDANTAGRACPAVDLGIKDALGAADCVLAPPWGRTAALCTCPRTGASCDGDGADAHMRT